MAICKNCDNHYPDFNAYCPYCSQKTGVHRLNVQAVLHEGVHYFTHTDKGVFKLFRDLISKRGVIAREYVEGKRKKHFPPFTFFLIVAGILLFVFSKPQFNIPIDLADKTSILKISDPIEKVNELAKYRRETEASQFIVRYFNYFAILSLPVKAFAFWLFYRRKYNFVENLVAGMYMLGFCLFAYAVLFLPSVYLLGVRKEYAAYGFLALQLFYFTSFYNGFLGNTRKRQFIKSFLVSGFSLIFWMFISSLPTKLYIENGFWGMLE